MLAIGHYGDIDNVPVEILDQIISHNKDDLSSIHNASYVSKTWRTVSLRYLFSFAEFCTQNDFARWNTIAEFLPEVLAHVQRVIFAPGKYDVERAIAALDIMYPTSDGGTRPNGYFEARNNAIDEARWAADLSPTDIPTIPTMPSVSSFHWVFWPCYFDFTPSTEHFFRSFPSTTDISFSCAELSMDDARMVLDAFAGVHSLRWENGIAYPPPGKEHIPFSGQLPRLQTLRLIGYSSMPYLRWLGAALANSPLREIELRSTLHSGTTKELEQLLKGASPTLEGLLLSSDMTSSTHVTSNINLPVLRIVTVDHIFQDPLQNSQTEMSSVASLLTDLSSASCPVLSHICLEFWFRDIGFTAPLSGDLFANWKGLARTMACSFPSLTTVRLFFRIDVPWG